ncbi:hypothetical protein [Mesorhizobium sp.]|uniref:hypothetical protein n=1 Tax=Mesorhizobium sp. TaxID=1871066 RepID=UPI000FE654EE|nr:hypothetical protein [Mesorhizobium sp.]RWI99969.1 MAG: hypothetical protein EOR23_31935 [Mesorhizobium sp.]RWM04966.1 MAG: hypothetical protein EOR71_25580 [Mesorhizobium sp.]RWO82162.1 MAG: hypothetical protein EOQ95_27620 [Mesorhizobium sp.]
MRFDGSNALCTKTAGEFAESPPPAAPTSYVQVGNYFFNISWQDNSVNETGFVVDRRTADSDWQRIQTVVFAGGPNTGTTNGPRYFFVDKEPGSVIDEYRDGVYCFRVGAYHVDATSYDEEICKPTVPRPPLNFRVVAVGYTNVTLSWRDNSNVEEEFVLRRCRADIGEDDTECLEPERIIASWGANGSPPNYTDMTARSDQSYEYSLLVRNASGQRNVRVTATTKPDPGDEPESTEPNLYFSGSITLTPFSVEPNRSFTVSWTGCNSGATSTGDFHDKLLLHKYQTEGSVNERSIKNEPVAPNGCYVNEVEYDGLPEGDYFLDVLLDGTGEVNESREDDNNNSYGFMVAPGD